MNLSQGLHRFHVGDRLCEIAVYNGPVYLAGQVPDDASQDIGARPEWKTEVVVTAAI
jgi:hypothetical protein